MAMWQRQYCVGSIDCVLVIIILTRALVCRHLGVPGIMYSAWNDLGLLGDDAGLGVRVLLNTTIDYSQIHI